MKDGSLLGAGCGENFSPNRGLLPTTLNSDANATSPSTQLQTTTSVIKRKGGVSLYEN